MAVIEIRNMRLTPELFGPPAETLPECLARLAAETWESVDCYRAKRVATLRGFMGRMAVDRAAADCDPELRPGAWAGCECEDCAAARRAIEDYQTYRENEFLDRVVWAPAAVEGESMRRGLARRSAETWEPQDAYGRELVKDLRVECLALARAGTVELHESNCGCPACYRAVRAAAIYDRLQERGDSRGAYVLGYQDGLAAESELAADLRADSEVLPVDGDCDCESCTRYRKLRADYERAEGLVLRYSAALARMHSDLMHLGEQSIQCNREGGS